ncbi:MAG: aldose epimerase family protein [Eubacteriales bacterium]|nr:aldose epimerase family protein [Eubacteriales bacterium]
MSVEKKLFGTLKTGESVYLYKIENKKGAYVEVCDFGALLVRVCVPDRDGLLRDVVLGYDNLEAYLTNGCYFGATVGRSGNRIAGGRFALGGVEYQLPQNENENNLHSGPEGYQLKLWNVKELEEDSDNVAFERVSPDGEQGFPGALHICVRYTFTEENELKISYDGVCDQDTVVNMTNHSYFNLNGAGNGSILNQKLQINADYYTPVIDSKSIPTGELDKVEGTPMDFRTEKEIGKEIDADFQQLIYTGGYDHNFVPNGYQKGVVRKIAQARCEESGIVMEVFSDLPGVQFYAGNFIIEEKGKDGKTYGKRDGFCLETQYAPNSVNEYSFESPVLEAKDTYHTETIYQFNVSSK